MHHKGSQKWQPVRVEGRTSRAGRTAPGSLRHAASARRTCWLSAASLLALAASLLPPAQSFGAEEHVAVEIGAGQTYELKGLDPDATPEVTFTEHHPFTLQCPAPGTCYIRRRGWTWERAHRVGGGDKDRLRCDCFCGSTAREAA